MVDLILRPSGLAERYNKPWSLQLRHAGLAETDYETLCRIDDAAAQRIIAAGKPFWLFGVPDWSKRAEARALEKARALREKAAEIEEQAALNRLCGHE